MTNEEKAVVFDTLRLLADCELERLSMARKKLKFSLDSPMVKDIGERIAMTKVLNHIQELGDKLDGLLTKINEIKRGIVITEPKPSQNIFNKGLDKR